MIRGSQTRFYHADGLGSIRRLTDESGNITDTYIYTAFGELLSHTGTDPHPYAFAGEPLDLNSGFYYNRARWMDPRVGRFVEMDIWKGWDIEPLSLHKYLYANGNPVNDVDPTGKFSLSVTQISVAINLIVSGISGGARGAVPGIGPLKWALPLLLDALAGVLAGALVQASVLLAGRVLGQFRRPA